MSDKVSSPSPEQQLSPQKRALLELMLKQRRELKRTQELPPILPRPEHHAAPLSYAQQRLWVLAQLQPDNPAYNLVAPIRLKGRLVIDKLERAFQAMIARHEALRTTFDMVDGEPVQTIHSQIDWHLEHHDVSTLPIVEQEPTIRQLIRQAVGRAFDLQVGPLLRVVLVRIGEEDHIVALCMHHIISDDWSMGVLVREMMTLYQGYITANPTALPELSIQYADYAVWQREHLAGERLAGQVSYWQEQLKGELPVLQMATDRVRPPVQTFAGRVEPVSLSVTLSQQLRQLARQEEATLYMVLLAGWLTLLHRYSGQREVMVGMPIANRRHEQLAPLIGYFVNTLPLRGDLSGDPTFRTLLQRVRQVVIGGLEHQDVPIEKVIEVIQPERDLSRSLLFQTMFTLRTVEKGALQLPGLNVELLAMPSETAQVDLSLTLTDKAVGLLGSLEYNTDLFDTETIQRLLEHLELVLRNAAANPDQPISAIPLLTGAEQEKLLVAWNPLPGQGEPLPSFIHELLTQQAQRTPQATAIINEGLTLSYEQLNTYANQLAHLLRGQGVGPEVRVGIKMGRSAAACVAMLSVLKAGGAYVPLDPNYPAERLAFMRQDAGIAVLLTHSSNTTDERFEHDNISVITLDDELSALTGLPTTAPAVPELHLDNLAYLIYTSGTTGRPKGVMVTHRNLLSYLAAIIPPLGLQPDDRVLNFASPSFDATTEELYPAWLAGAAVVQRPDVIAPNDEFTQFVTHHQLTVLSLPVPFWHEWVYQLSLNPTPLPSQIRMLLLNAAEPSATRYQQWLSLGGSHIRSLNTYGPTETTVTATLYQPEATQATSLSRIPIGRPLSNCQLYILDDHLAPVPVGVPGRLYVGGEGVTRGYLARPRATATAYLPHPFSQTAGARLYDTGDRVRYLPDGNIEFLGRVDHQAKIRGFRVEPGEIEAVLTRHPQVQEGAVRLWVSENGDPRLAAYVVVTDAQTITTQELRSYLQEQLPPYMVPDAILSLPTLPRSPNGKIAYRTLPQPTFTEVERTTPYAPPRNEVEAVLVAIFAELLHLPQVGIFDDFFALGGHSLLATQLIHRIQRTLRVSLPLRSLFEGPSVAQLATFIHAAPVITEVTGAAETIPPRGELPAIPLSLAQQRLWVLTQLEPDNPAYNLLVPMRLKGHLAVDILERCFQMVIARHEALRTTFDMVDGEPVQTIHSQIDWYLEQHDVSNLPVVEQEPTVRDLIRQAVGRAFDLQVGPLLRVVLVRIGEDEHIVALCMHHIISDDWSMGVLVREMMTLYQRYVTANPTALPELSIQYADYVVWQREHLAGERLAGQVSYWQEQLKGELPVLQMATDRPRPPVQTFAGRVEPVSLAAELSQQLRQLARQEEATLYMVLLAGWLTLLHRYSGQREVMVGMPIANRRHEQLAPLIGYFVNTLPLRGDLSGDPTFRALLGRVRQVVIGGLEHQDVPIEKVIEVIQPERDLSRSLLFQTMFTVLNAPKPPVQPPGLEVTFVDVRPETAQVDLALYISDAPQLKGTLEYNTDLFDTDTIQRLLKQLETLLSSAAANPDQPISAIPLLTGAEQEKLLVAWNPLPGQGEPLPSFIHELLTQQAQRTPQATAIINEGLTLSYEQLNTYANQLAHLLRGQGVGPEVRVGIEMGRSAAACVAMLAVLKAGGAYVPLDPNYPAERLAFMRQDAGIAVLLIHPSNTGNLQSVADNILVLTLDDDLSALTGLPTTAPAVPELHLDNLAYLIYTSGTTGRPKGVMVTHRNLLSYLGAVIPPLDLQPDDRVLNFASPSFDATTEELYPAWLAGAAVVQRPDVIAPNDEFTQFVTHHQLTVLSLPVPFWHEWVYQLSLNPTPLPSQIRMLLLNAAEPSATRYQQWLSLGGSHIHSLNTYGPTETTVTATLYQPEATQATSLSRIPIGRPLSNCQLYILDDHLAPVPVGVPGRLYVGGEGVTRGYLARPRATATAYLPHPFSQTTGARLYDTGDRVRYLPDGNIEFLGRVDHQIKIRGFRVEPGEIEAVLTRHPQVQEGAVRLWPGENGDPRLAAYVVVTDAQTTTAQGLRSYLQEQLPPYMVPDAILSLPTLPRSPNGKIAYRTLPQPTFTEVERTTPYAPPRNEVEAVLVAIFAELLHLPQVGIFDDFFALGGHSLLATQLIHRIQRTLRVSLPLRSLFDAPYVAALAEQLATDPQQMRRIEKAAQLIMALNEMSDEQVTAMLAAQRSRS